MRIRPLLAILSVAAVLIDFSPALAGTNPIVWNNGPALSNVGGLTSQLSRGVSAQTADDFLFTGGATVTDVEWTGRYFNGTALPNPGPSFTIRFYADNGTGGAPTGGPGDPSATALATYTTGVGGAHQVANIFGNSKYDYSYALPTPFAASPGVKYWLSVQAIFDFPPQWIWSNSTTHLLSPAVHGFPPEQTPYWSTFAGFDMAFTLRGIPLASCPADVSPAGGDGFVNVDDLLEIIGEWGPCASPCPEDIDVNGIVNVNDLLAVITAWGPCP